MRQESIAIIGAVICLAAIVVPGIRGLRKDIVALGERIARLEVATEGFVNP